MYFQYIMDKYRIYIVFKFHKRRLQREGDIAPKTRYSEMGYTSVAWALIYGDTGITIL